MSTVTLTKADAGSSVKARRGDIVVISLPENATTGYTWALDNLDPNILRFKDSTYSLSAGGGIGGGGIRTFTFNAINVGGVNLNLKLRREWTGDASIIDRYSATINVVP